ncbi:MAG: DUF885 domain-containing protein [Pseudonocardia sp.]|nr:DUF885 domain-containing protein [Pseudonocardia sp.]
MTETPGASRRVRDLADAHVTAQAALDPVLATSIGLAAGADELPDLSPAGTEAVEALARDTLRALDGLGPVVGADERRCARLLRERLGAQLASSAAGEGVRNVQTLFGPIPGIRQAFTLMPAATEDDWRTIAVRLAAVPAAFDGYVESLREGVGRGLTAAPRQVDAVVAQLGTWAAAGNGRGWFATFTDDADVPAALRSDLDAGARAAAEAVVALRDVLAREYRPAAEGTPDAVGEARYRIAARLWNGADVDAREAYDWGWAEFRRLRGEMAAEAERVSPGLSAAEAMSHLTARGPSIDGVEAVREHLQRLMDTAIAELDGTHFDLAPPLKRVEARIAPAGSAAAPYYTQPSLDFSRPGRTWLPTLGRTRFPTWDLVSTWYHEGVPGHHLQLAQWALCSDRLSTLQTTEVGMVSANVEGWALYAERLMDELGYVTDPGERLGYLDAQMMRAIRVIIDIGMHLELTIPADSPVGAGQTWTHDLGREFFGAHSGRDAAFVDSELLRYLGGPGQAIGYKLGERAWLAGREAARTRQGADFDLKRWHMAALSQGSLGLDDLVGELADL